MQLGVSVVQIISGVVVILRPVYVGWSGVVWGPGDWHSAVSWAKSIYTKPVLVIYVRFRLNSSCMNTINNKTHYSACAGKPNLNNVKMATNKERIQQ